MGEGGKGGGGAAVLKGVEGTLREGTKEKKRDSRQLKGWFTTNGSTLENRAIYPHTTQYQSE